MIRNKRVTCLSARPFTVNMKPIRVVEFVPRIKFAANNLADSRVGTAVSNTSVASTPPHA